MESRTSKPVCTGSLTKSRSMIAGAGRSTGSWPSASIVPPPSSGRPSGSTMRPSKAGPTGTRTTSPVPSTRSPASTPSVSSSRTHPRTSRSRVSGEADLTAFEAHEFVEPHIGQPGHERNAVGDRLDTADLLGDGRKRRRSDALSCVPQPACQDLRACSSRLQLLADSIEIRAPTVAHDRVAAVKLDAGDQGRIGAKRERQLRTERRLERIANVLRLSFGKRRGGHDLDRRDLPRSPTRSFLVASDDSARSSPTEPIEECG